MGIVVSLRDCIGVLYGYRSVRRDCIGVLYGYRSVRRDCIGVLYGYRSVIERLYRSIVWVS